MSVTISRDVPLPDRLGALEGGIFACIILDQLVSLWIQNAMVYIFTVAMNIRH